MFKLQPNPTFKARVPITIAGQDKPAMVEMEFRHFSREAVKEFFESLPGKDDADALAQIIVGWSGVDAAYSAEALATLINNFPSASGSIFKVFSSELFEARTKN